MHSAMASTNHILFPIEPETVVGAGEQGAEIFDIRQPFK